jgi:tRNA A37 threonylcarbamoyladenosine synthetase subunit TsaC/SUA5/YrdC
MMGTRIELLIDGGPTRGGAASTIVDVTEPAPRLVRAGAIAWEDIQTCLDRG